MLKQMLMNALLTLPTTVTQMRGAPTLTEVLFVCVTTDTLETALIVKVSQR